MKEIIIGTVGLVVIGAVGVVAYKIYDKKREKDRKEIERTLEMLRALAGVMGDKEMYEMTSDCLTNY